MEPIHETDIYRFFYATPGTPTSQFPYKDRERFEALEVQLLGLYSLFGNGVIVEGDNAWAIQQTSCPTPTIFIGPGKGHIDWKYAETTTNTAENLVIPTGVDLITTPLTFYAYAAATDTTHYLMDVDFQIFTAPQSDPTMIYLGLFVMSQERDTMYYDVTSVDITGRDEISLFGSLAQLIKNHVHTGGTNPSKINLALHTQGLLPAAFIEPDLDASQVSTGKLSLDRLPQIDHNSLSDIGVLTHPQIDSLLAALQMSSLQELSSVTTANLLRTLLFLKASFVNVDRFLLNTFLFIPGTTASDYIDAANTTATVEPGQIKGLLAASAGTDSVTWQGEAALQAAIDAFDLTVNDFPDSDNNPLDTLLRSQNVIVDGNSLTLTKPLNFGTVHSKAGTATWESVVQTADLPTPDPTHPEQIPVGGQLDLFLLERFKQSSSFVSNDWSEVNRLEFELSLPNPSATGHDDIHFFLIGATLADFPSGNQTLTLSDGTQVSISQPDAITVLQGDSDLAIVDIDLQQFSERSHVQGFGFFIAAGQFSNWKLSDYTLTMSQPDYDEMRSPEAAAYLATNDVPKNITAYVWNDLFFSPSGFLLFRLSEDILTTFNVITSSATIPSVDVGVTAPSVSLATRTADDVANLPFTGWDALSGDSITSSPAKSIDIIVRLTASSDLTAAPSFDSVTLQFTISSSPDSRTWNTALQLATALDMINLSIVSSGGNDWLALTDSSLVGATFFIEGDIINVIGADLLQLPEEAFDGASLPVSPRQAWSKVGAGLRGPKFVSRGQDGTLLIADTRNDRILEIGPDGSLVHCLQGNVYLPIAARDFVALSAVHNVRLGRIYVAFSQILTSGIDPTKFTLATADGANSLSLGGSAATFSTVNDAVGNSAVIQIQLSASAANEVGGWGKTMVLSISPGGVTGVAGTATSVPSPSPSVGGSAPSPYDQGGMGTLTEIAGNTSGGSSTTNDETNTFSFTGGTSLNSTSLIGLNGVGGVVSINVDEADIVFAPIVFPMSAQLVGDSNFVVAQDYTGLTSPNVINVDISGNIAWSILGQYVTFDSDQVGNATYLDDGSVLCCSPSMGQVLQIVPVSNAVTFSHTTIDGTPQFAIRLDDGDTVVVLSDSSGLNSRVYEMTPSGDVIRDWGLGRLSDPTGVALLESGNWVIST